MNQGASSTWGHPQSEWDAAKADAQAVMIEVARHRGNAGTITYRALTARIGSITFDPHGHDFHALLGRVATRRMKQGADSLVPSSYFKKPGFRARDFLNSQGSVDANFQTNRFSGLRN